MKLYIIYQQLFDKLANHVIFFLALETSTRLIFRELNKKTITINIYFYNIKCIYYIINEIKNKLLNKRDQFKL